MSNRTRPFRNARALGGNAELQAQVFARRVAASRSGKVTEDDLLLSDVTTWDAASTQHGFLKKLDMNSAHFMDGTGNWTTPVTSGTVIAVAMGLMLAVTNQRMSF